MYMQDECSNSVDNAVMYLWSTVMTGTFESDSYLQDNKAEQKISNVETLIDTEWRLNRMVVKNVF